jgi:hypothetical protein
MHGMIEQLTTTVYKLLWIVEPEDAPRKAIDLSHFHGSARAKLDYDTICV